MTRLTNFLCQHNPCRIHVVCPGVAQSASDSIWFGNYAGRKNERNLHYRNIADGYCTIIVSALKVLKC